MIYVVTKENGKTYKVQSVNTWNIWREANNDELYKNVEILEILKVNWYICTCISIYDEFNHLKIFLRRYAVERKLFLFMRTQTDH